MPYDDDPHNDLDNMYDPPRWRFKAWWVWVAIAVAIVAWLVTMFAGIKVTTPPVKPAINGEQNAPRT